MKKVTLAPMSTLALAALAGGTASGLRKAPPLRSTDDLEDGALVYSRGGQVYVVDDGSLRRSDLSLEQAKLRGARALPRARA